MPSSASPALPLFSIDALGITHAPVIALTGEEDLGRAARFEITFPLGGAEIEPAAMVGAAARLDLPGGRTHGGVIAEVEIDEGTLACRATLLPRAWLLSRGRGSRAFERLS